MGRNSKLPDILLSRLSEFIAEKMGLHFPAERWNDLQRGLESLAKEFRFSDPAACAEWLLAGSLSSIKCNFKLLAGHLTVGETYFFRERKGRLRLEAI